MKKFLKNITKDPKFIIGLVILAVLIVAGIFIYNKRYAPTSETMSLNDYYEVGDGEMAVIINGELITATDGAAKGIVRNETPYVEYTLMGDSVNDVYAYDAVEKKVAFTTIEGTYKANIGSKGYTFNGSSKGTDYIPCVEENGTAYLALDFVRDTIGIEYSFAEDPDRAAITTAGKEVTTATIRSDTPMRRFGGNKSKIVATAAKGDKVTLIENYGSWTQILTDDAVLGCVPNGYIKDKDKYTVKTVAAQENLSHNLINGTVRLGWHQVFSVAGNDEMASVIETAVGMNVISPTWLQIKDNRGSLNDFSSRNYVNYCHDKGLKVWTLVSNIENEVDENTLFNTTSVREALVDNIVNAVVSSGADGVNVDMESVGDANVEGYVEFIKELSLKCNAKGLTVSVDNYNTSSADYDVDIQSRFADYIIVFGYDETWTGSRSAGSNNSMPFVKKTIEGMLDAGVDKKQLIYAIPFYTRLWNQTGDVLTSEPMTLKDTSALLASNNAQATWLNDNKENYAEWTNGNSKYMIWIVDNKSLQERCSYVASKNIAGIAAWKLGNETQDTWTMISNTIK